MIREGNRIVVSMKKCLIRKREDKGRESELGREGEEKVNEKKRERKGKTK